MGPYRHGETSAERLARPFREINQVLAEGTPDEVKNDPDVQRVYLGEAE